MADVGLVGLPNAGKSTLLSRLTRANPKIADYPFTTLTPNLGVAGEDAERFVVADVPGLIEGASEGRGLGHRFLRHVVRCRALVLVVDLRAEDPSADLAVLRAELAAYDPALAARRAIVVGTKADLVEDVASAGATLDPDAIGVSSVSGEGLEALAERLGLLAREAADAEAPRQAHVVLRPGRPRFTVARGEDGRWLVAGQSVDRWVMETDIDDESQVRRLQTSSAGKGWSGSSPRSAPGGATRSRSAAACSSTPPTTRRHERGGRGPATAVRRGANVGRVAGGARRTCPRSGGPAPTSPRGGASRPRWPTWGRGSTRPRACWRTSPPGTGMRRPIPARPTATRIGRTPSTRRGPRR